MRRDEPRAPIRPFGLLALLLAAIFAIQDYRASGATPTLPDNFCSETNTDESDNGSIILQFADCSHQVAVKDRRTTNSVDPVLLFPTSTDFPRGDNADCKNFVAWRIRTQPK